MEREYIKIYSYKKIKVGKEIMDIAPAILENGSFKVLEGKFREKYLSPLDMNFSNHDYCCQPLTLVEKNLLTDFHPENTDLIHIEKYKEKCKIQYYIVLKAGEQIYLHETVDKRIIEEFKCNLNPSVAGELGNLLEKSNVGNLLLSPELLNKIREKENNLPTQNPNKKEEKKDIKENAISEKYRQILLANITKNISLSYMQMPNSKVKELKSVILILGPRGTGKTFMIESIAEMFGVPSTIEDATRYTPPAYQGADIEDFLMNLYAHAEEQEERFEHGIVFLDEFDKICKISKSMP